MITIQAETLQNWNRPSETLELWWIAESDWVDIDGTLYGAGNPETDQTYVQRVTGLVVNVSADTLLIPAHDVPITRNARVNPSVRLRAWIMLISGTLATPLKEFPASPPNGFTIPELLVDNTWAGLIEYNRFAPALPRPQFYDADVTNRLIAQNLGALSNPMTTPNDLIVGGVAGVPARLAKGSDSQVLGVDPVTHNLAYLAQSGGIPVYNVVDYGADPTGVADSIAGFNAALAAAVAARKGIVYIPPGLYKWNSMWTVGDGTSTTISTYAGISIIGAGGPRLNNVSPASAVRIVWNGATSTSAVMMRVAGPIGGLKIEGLHLDCDNKAGSGLQVIHAPDADISDISIWGYTGPGLDIDSRGASSFNGGTEITNSYGDGGVVRNFALVSVNNNATGIRLGSTGTVANWLFESGTISMGGSTGSAPLELRHTDHCVFLNCVGNAEQGIRIKPLASAAGQPHNTMFYGGSWNGVHAACLVGTQIEIIDTTITADTTAGFPAAGVLKITSSAAIETVTYTSKNATQFLGVVREQYSTVAAVHTAGSLIQAANDVVIDNTDVTWNPTTGYFGVYFQPFATADGALVPTDLRMGGVTDTGLFFGRYVFKNRTAFGPLPFTPLTPIHLKTLGEEGLRIEGIASRLDFYSNQTNAASRNWTTRLDSVEFGDMAFFQSTAKDGDPYAAGAVRFRLRPSGAAVIRGTTTNDAAAAGEVGELIEGTAALTSVSLDNVTGKTIISISLTAGDWDVSGIAYYTPGATTTVNELFSSISLVDNTTSLTPGRFGDIGFAGAVVNVTVSQPVPRVRISLAATTTIYLVGFANFGVSTMTAGGYLSARRLR